MKSLLKYYIYKMPKNKVSEEEIRYPINPAGMRSFLIKFFARYYLQIQNSLINYICSDDFINIIKTGRIRILDINSGPAVASLAITDMAINIIRLLENTGEWERNKRLEFNYVLNDTSDICIDTGQNMIKDYFNRIHDKAVFNNHLFKTQKAFPDNMSQLRRKNINSGAYDVVIFSYVIFPLIEKNNFRSIVRGFSDVGNLCSYDGVILIIQDKYKKYLIERLCNALSVKNHKDVTEQHIFPKRNENETYKYTYYSCLYTPKKSVNKLQTVA